GRYWEKEWTFNVDLDVAKTIASAVMWVNITDSWTLDDGEKEEAEVETKSERVPVYLASLLIGQPAEVRSLRTPIYTVVEGAGEFLSSELCDALRPMVVWVSAIKRIPPGVTEW
ncbi:hypothetical protein Pmar_PMAR023904, partial [Perkinsus marinus ATCC 50983]